MNTIVYVIDALRADHLSCYGYERETTPHLDRFAAQAARFENAFTVSTWTRSAAGSLLTGTYPSVHGAITSATPFHPPTPTLAQTLRARGVRTMGISAIANVSSALGFDRGFDTFADLYKDPALMEARAVVEMDTHAGGTAESHRMVMPLAEDANARIFEWLGENRGTDFFLFVWVIDPHNPYWPPEGFQPFLDPGYAGRIDGGLASIRGARTPADMQRLIDLYDSEIFYTDHCFGQLCAKLEELDLWDDTLMIVTGDHGEAFGDHGHMLHGHIPYEELLRVPFMAKIPSISGVAGQAIPEMVSHLDIAPTVLDLLEIEDADARRAHQGKSIAPLLQARGELHAYLYSECQPSMAGTLFSSIRSPQWKLCLTEPPAEGRNWRRVIKRLLGSPRLLWELATHPQFYWKRQMAVQREMLFNLGDDPGERINLRESRPDQANQLKSLLLAWRERNRQLAAQGPGAGDFEVDEETISQLKGLGYL